MLCTGCFGVCCAHDHLESKSLEFSLVWSLLAMDSIVSVCVYSYIQHIHTWHSYLVLILYIKLWRMCDHFELNWVAFILLWCVLAVECAVSIFESTHTCMTTTCIGVHTVLHGMVRI